MGIVVYVVEPGMRVPSAGARNGLSLPADVRKQATSLLSQQFWCFGCDIRRPEGNLLLSDRFVKHRPPEDAAITSSRYTRCLDASHSIVLWGFGLAWVDCENVLFLPRHTIVPIVGCLECGIDEVWLPEDFGSLRRPGSTLEVTRSRVMLIESLQWIQAYEARVAAAQGGAYRASSLAAWKRPVCSADQIADAWTDVIDRLQSAWSPLVA